MKDLFCLISCILVGEKKISPTYLTIRQIAGSERGNKQYFNVGLKRNIKFKLINFESIYTNTKAHPPPFMTLMKRKLC
jgi:hypothetical protein